MQAGPFHVAPFLTIKDFGYDDNVRLDAEERVGDYTITVGPGARAVVPFGHRAALALWDEIDFAAYAQEKDLNHVNNTFRGKMHLYMRDLTMFAHGSSESYKERPNTEIDFRIRRTTNEGRFGFSYSPASRLRTDFFVNRADITYNADTASEDPETGELIAEDLTRDETSLGFEARLKIRPRTKFLIDLRTGRIDFDLSFPDRDSASNTAMGGFEFDLAGPLRGVLKVGHKNLTPDEDHAPGADGVLGTPDDVEIESFSGLVADTSLALSVGGRGAIKGTYTRDTGFSILGDNLYYILETQGLSYQHFVSSRIFFELGRQLVEVDYPLEFFNPDLEGCGNASLYAPECQDLRRDDITIDTLALWYRTGPTLSLGLSLDRRDRDSTFDLEDTTRNTITTLVEYTP